MTFVVGTIALALLFLLPRWNKKIPAGLVVLFGAIGLSTVLDLSGNYGVEVVGELPKGLPSLTIPQVPFTTYLAMVLPAIGVLLVAFSEALGVAHEFAEKHGYEVNADQELNAHALANIASALFGGMIAAGSMSASAVKEGAGARTQVTNLVAWVVTIVTLLFLTPLFAPLPEAVLAALIIHAVWHIIASRSSEDPAEFAGRSLVWRPGVGRCVVNRCVARHGHRPGGLVDIRGLQDEPATYCFIGTRPRVPGAYSDLNRHPENAPVPGVLIVRIDAQLYYANALTVRDRVKAMVAEMETPPQAVIFDASAQEEIDVTSTDIIKGLVEGAAWERYRCIHR